MPILSNNILFWIQLEIRNNNRRVESCKNYNKNATSAISCNQTYKSPIPRGAALQKAYNFIKSTLNSYKELCYLAVSQLLKPDNKVKTK